MTRLKHCDECAHFMQGKTVHDECPCPIHTPTFYNPRGPMDRDWGYKRDCADFRPAPSPKTPEKGGE